MKLICNRKQRRKIRTAALTAKPTSYLALTLLPATMFGFLAISFTSEEHALLAEASADIFRLLSLVLAIFVSVEIWALSHPRRKFPKVVSGFSSTLAVVLTIASMLYFSGVLTGFGVNASPDFESAKNAYEEASKELDQKHVEYEICLKERNRRIFEIRLAIESGSGSGQALLNHFEELKRFCDQALKKSKAAYRKFTLRSNEFLSVLKQPKI